MPLSVRDLIASMFGGREPLVPSTQPFAAVHLREMIRRLRLDELASGRASAGLPLANDITDPVEQDIYQEVAVLARRGFDDYCSQLQMYDSRIKQASITADQRYQIEAAGSTVIADLEAPILDDESMLHTRKGTQSILPSQMYWRRSSQMTFLQPWRRLTKVLEGSALLAGAPIRPRSRRHRTSGSRWPKLAAHHFDSTKGEPN